MTTVSEIMTFNHPVTKMLRLLQIKWKLTSEVVDNIVWILLEETCILLEKNKFKEYSDVKKVLNMVESLEIN